MNDDRATLIAALEVAASAYQKQEPRPTLLGTNPTHAIIDPLTAAVGACAAYQAVAGHAIFSGGSGPVLDASSLATRLFEKGVRWGNDIPAAADWLLRLLTTRETKGLFKVAIWGIALDEDVELSATTRLVPFAALPDSWMKGRISDRAKPCYDGSAWLTQTYFDMPTVALVEEVADFPYIRADLASFEIMNALIAKAHELCVLIQAASLGQPLAVACWFEYADRELEYSEWENTFTWLLPEVAPHVKRISLADPEAIKQNLKHFQTLTTDRRSKLLRSMERFRQSQCRRETIDRILDLALAFEISVSEKGDNAPPGWKVSVRSAQLIGGPLSARQENRAAIAALYDLRNQATHGGTLRPRSASQTVDGIVATSARLYVELTRTLLALPSKPRQLSLSLELPPLLSAARPRPPINRDDPSTA